MSLRQLLFYLFFLILLRDIIDRAKNELSDVPNKFKPNYKVFNLVTFSKIVYT